MREGSLEIVCENKEKKETIYGIRTCIIQRVWISAIFTSYSFFDIWFKELDLLAQKIVVRVSC